MPPRGLLYIPLSNVPLGVRSGMLRYSFRRENDRFWILAVHPTNSLIAAGHDSGMVVFKLDRERPVFGLGSSSSHGGQVGCLLLSNTCFKLPSVAVSGKWWLPYRTEHRPGQASARNN